ncbi:MAG: type 4a pilus biogenesis protein PilO [Oceanospirillaceae bacterium]|nr:type 4a pilus biogenesis protein PilO [Oceanospirillaceae bacterium]MCP5351145.1 type 4a pilus biogenesis protein PilO [Oceanospirillaceae bacterium]
MSFKDILDSLKDIDPESFGEIDWNNMGSWPVAGKILFAFVISLIVMICWYFFLTSDVVAQRDAAVQQEEQLRQDFETKAFRVANLDAYKKQLAEIEESFGTLLRQLPRDTEVPGLLEDITNAALGAGLTIQEIKLQPEVETEFYTELPIAIEVKGTYHDMGGFVSGVANLSRIVTLHDFTISGSGKGSLGDKLDLKIIAKTYRYNDSAGKDAKKAKKGGNK